MITRWCLLLLCRERKVKSPGNLNYQGFSGTDESSPEYGQYLAGIFHNSHHPHKSSFKPAGLRSVGIAVRLAKGRKAQRGWLHTARVGLTRRPAALEWSGSAEAIPAPLVMHRQGSSPRSSGLGRLCLAKPLTTGDRYSKWANGFQNRIGHGSLKVIGLLLNLFVSHGRRIVVKNRSGINERNLACQKVLIITSKPLSVN